MRIKENLSYKWTREWEGSKQGMVEFKGKRQGLENNSVSGTAMAYADNRIILWADGAGEVQWGEQCPWMMTHSYWS